VTSQAAAVVKWDPNGGMEIGLPLRLVIFRKPGKYVVRLRTEAVTLAERPLKIWVEPPTQT
jgi:hypothetical protein